MNVQSIRKGVTVNYGAIYHTLSQPLALAGMVKFGCNYDILLAKKGPLLLKLCRDVIRRDKANAFTP